MNNKLYCRPGFTLIEVLLVIGLIGFLVALAIPFYQGFQVSSELDNTVHGLVQTLRFAQAEAMASKGFQPWGVHIEEKRFVLFQGSEYRSNDPFSEETAMPGVLSLQSEYKDVVFDRVTGTTAMAGKIVISSNTNESHVIIINNLGVVNAP
jgi:prepilin-type N-terminal cleavage/methylation domain-containing protein